MFFSIPCIQHETLPKEKTASDHLLDIGHRTDKSVRQVLVPRPPVTRSRVIPDPRSRVRERAILPNDYGRQPATLADLGRIGMALGSARGAVPLAARRTPRNSHRHSLAGRQFYAAGVRLLPL